jgi:uncharacterized membrane protein YfcA
MKQTLSCPYFQKAFGWCVPIGGLAGLVGLGGGEFRLPILMHVVGFGAKAAVPLNLMVSLVTLSFAFIVRSGSISLSSLQPYWAEIVGLILGGTLSAIYGATVVKAVSSERLVQVIAALLGGLGLLILAEAVYPFQYAEIIPEGAAVHLAAGFLIGIGIGLVSSMLGVAGGELLIPAMMFIFGADIRTAGTASIVISVWVVSSGLFRYWRMNAIPTGRGAQRITTAMAAGSILGAILGGLAVAYAPVTALKVQLGCVLLAAAAKTATARHA